MNKVGPGTAAGISVGLWSLPRNGTALGCAEGVKLWAGDNSTWRRGVADPHFIHGTKE